MGKELVAGVETGGTKILARIVDRTSKDVIAQGRWPTGSAEDAVRDLIRFFSDYAEDGRIAAVGLAAFGPLVVDPAAADLGRMLATPKPGWTGSNLRAELDSRLGIPVTVDTDVNAAAIAEQRLGAGAGLPSVAYVTVGTGIGAGLAIEGRSLKGALHPEAGHIRLIRRTDDQMESSCAFHSDCAEGLASGPAVERRLGDAAKLADKPPVMELVAAYLGQLAAALVLAWSPHRIVWGGGVIGSSPQLLPLIEASLAESLGGYGVWPKVTERGYCVAARLADAGLEGALLIAGMQAEQAE